jgi:HEAT repeats
MRFSIRDLFLATMIAALAVVGTALGSTADASDAPGTRELAEEWLRQMPQPVRGKPPPENIQELRETWIERGKRVPGIKNALIVILKDEKSSLRSFAALVVGRIVGEKALDGLEDAFSSDDPRLRLNALESLGIIDSPKRTRVLATALTSTYREPHERDDSVPTNNAIIRANIAILLSESRDDGARQLLKSLSSKEKDPYVMKILRSNTPAPNPPKP